MQGAVIGGVVGLALPLWMSSGAYDLDVYSEILPSATFNCTNYTEPVNVTRPPLPEEM